MSLSCVVLSRVVFCSVLSCLVLCLVFVVSCFPFYVSRPVCFFLVRLSPVLSCIILPCLFCSSPVLCCPTQYVQPCASVSCAVLSRLCYACCVLFCFLCVPSVSSIYPPGGILNILLRSILCCAFSSMSVSFFWCVYLLCCPVRVVRCCASISCVCLVCAVLCCPVLYCPVCSVCLLCYAVPPNASHLVRLSSVFCFSLFSPYIPLVEFLISFCVLSGAFFFRCLSSRFVSFWCVCLVLCSTSPIFPFLSRLCFVLFCSMSPASRFCICLPYIPLVELCYISCSVLSISCVLFCVVLCCLVVSLGLVSNYSIYSNYSSYSKHSKRSSGLSCSSGSSCSSCSSCSQTIPKLFARVVRVVRSAGNSGIGSECSECLECPSV